VEKIQLNFSHSKFSASNECSFTFKEKVMQNRNLYENMTEGPIIDGLMDVDFYKFTMLQFIFKYFYNVEARFTFRLRTKGVRLAEVISEADLRSELDKVMIMMFSRTDLHYLRGTNEYSERMFKEDFLEHLAKLRLPKYDVKVVDGQFEITLEGRWAIVTLWETIVLSIVNELYYRATIRNMSPFERDMVIVTGMTRLNEKIRILKDIPLIKFTDFGTRRRFSRAWQTYVVEMIANELPGQFVGTSNTRLAEKLGLLPMGTNAHELPMVMAALAAHGTDAELLDSQLKMLHLWWEMYDYGLSIALPDTFGSNSLFNDDTTNDISHYCWKGLRQDSGDPKVFGEKQIAWYQRFGVDPREKMLLFSDGLEISTMLELAKYFHGRIRVSFGWGTNLTNDLGLKPLSMVVKAAAARYETGVEWLPETVRLSRNPAMEWTETVKLSDNPAKAMGSLEDIARYKRVFNYHESNRVECTY